MAKKSKLLAALDAHKGRDYEAEKRKKQIKAADKKKKQRAQALGHPRPDDIEDGAPPELNGAEKLTLDNTANADDDDDFASFSESEQEVEADDLEAVSAISGSLVQPPNGEASASEADPDSDVPLSDLSEDDRADTIPHQRLTINNGAALLNCYKRVRIIRPKMPFSAHHSLISKLPTASTAIPDPNDDLTREMEFYRICRTAATDARGLLKKEGVPFTRPADYFAEMVKSDEHMGKVKKKMYDEAAGKKAASEARALRDAKKFGKAVQIAKEQERAKEKRQMLDKINTLKRKRKGQDTGTVNEVDDLFENVDVEDDAKRDSRGASGNKNKDSGFKRQKRDQKFGFGGKKRFAKSGDAASTSDMRDYSVKRMKPSKKGGGVSGTKRLGKARRAAAR